MARNREKNTDSKIQQRLNENSITYWIWSTKKRGGQNGYVIYLLLHCKYPHPSGFQQQHLIWLLDLQTHWEIAGAGWLCSPVCIHLTGSCELTLLILAELSHVSGALVWIQGCYHSDNWGFCLMASKMVTIE